jgi:ferredoxin
MKQTSYTVFDKHRVPRVNNPKQMRMARIEVDQEKCRECGICISVCPFGCLAADKIKKKNFMDGTARGGKYGMPKLENIKNGANYCFACNCCSAVCPHGAIRSVRSFSPGYRFKRLTQTTEMTQPKNY